MAVSKQPTITPETSSGEGLDEEPSSRGEAKWKRFHPFRVVRKIFRRRVKREGTTVVSDASKKSWSTSELQSVQDDSTGKCEVTSPLKIGLSVSHDSIFSPESNANVVSSEELNVPRGSSLSVRHTSIKNNMFKDELFTRVRARRDSDDDDDMGLPHSPCTSPTTIDVLNQGLKEKSSKSQTTCSAGSLISMGSSENDEDSAGHSSGHSSRMSLLDRRSLDSDGDPDFSQPVPLNHNAAHHKIAVRPKRTYGLPRRRLNQIAAAKVSTLPSTPEVTEDNGKVFQKLGSTEITKTFTEFSTLFTDETTESSSHLTEWQTSKLSSFSYSEMSTETLIHQIRENPVLDSSIDILKISSEEDSKLHVQEICKQLDNVSTSTEENENKMDDYNSNTNSMSEYPNKDISDMVSDLKPNLMDKCEEGTLLMESVSLVKSHIQESIKYDSMHVDETVENQSESSVSVSSLVKNIEKSDSFRNSEEGRLLDETKSSFTRSFQHDQPVLDSEDRLNSSKQADTNIITSNCEKASDSNSGGPRIIEKLNESYSFSSLDEPNMQRNSSQGYIKEAIKKPIPEKLDIDSEFVLKPSRKDVRQDSDSDSSSKENASEKKNENSLISSVYHEEESIMSNKSLSLGVEESRVFVSHHSSFSNDFKDILVTEAHNFAAVEENSGVSVQTSGDKLTDIKKEKCETWISSVGISGVTTSTTDVTVNPLTSNLCNSKMSEDKITISVTSKHEASRSKYTSHKKEDTKQQNIEFQKISAAHTNVDQKISPKEKMPLKPTHKSHLPDINPNVTNIKNTNSQKRVSVEIVPFSQRMKERKYQPIGFSNKESLPDPNRKNSNVLVERKLSDRKLSPKNKELDKANNRHSFSGALTCDGKKEEESVITKKVSKPEKLQYPVQIRIHKSVPKPEIKDKVLNEPNSCRELKSASNSEGSSDIKFQMQSAKVTPNDGKFLKDDKKMQDNATKWEVKIQPAASHTTSHIDKHEENFSPAVSPNIFHGKNESFKSENESKDFLFAQESESSLVKSHDNSWRVPKDTQPILSDDPEPELLRVFARRSIKQKSCDKGKADERNDKLVTSTSSDDSFYLEKSDDQNEMISISHNSTVIKISEISKSHISKPDLKKKSKSFCEKEKISPRSVSPLKEMNLIHKESPANLALVDSPLCNETIHPRQRLVSVPDVAVNFPPDSEKQNIPRNPQNELSEYSPVPSMKEEHIQRAISLSVPSPTASMNGSLTSLGVKENQDVLGGKEAHAPSWLQLAQQRRELREQRERLLLGGSPNSFMDASNKPSRSSKVWDMVNNFQKLQMT